MKNRMTNLAVTFAVALLFSGLANAGGLGYVLPGVTETVYFQEGIKLIDKAVKQGTAEIAAAADEACRTESEDMCEAWRESERRVENLGKAWGVVKDAIENMPDPLNPVWHMELRLQSQQQDAEVEIH